MLTSLRVLPLSAALACASPVEGTWAGSCDLEDEGGPNRYEILSVVLEPGEGDGLEGQAEMQPDWLTAPILGFATATRSGSEIRLEAEMGDLVQGFSLQLDGTLEDDVITGDCSAQVQSGSETSGSAVGTGRLERIDTDEAGG